MARKRRRSIGDTIVLLVIVAALGGVFAPGVGGELLGLSSRLGWPPLRCGQARSSLPDSEAHLRELELADCLHQRAAELSGGQRRRESIARAVCYEPELLLLAAPFKGLDGAARGRTAQNLLRHRNGAAVLCVTHDRADAAALGAVIVDICIETADAVSFCFI